MRNCTRCLAPFNRKKNESIAYFSRKTFCSRVCYWGSMVGRKPARVPPVGSFLGRKHSEETKKRISESKMGSIPPNKGKPSMLRGEKCHFWRGGVSKINGTERHAIMSSLEYRMWRRGVFERDNYTCLVCGVMGGKLNADHIKPFAKYPELRLELANGRTLCESCHRKTPTYGMGAVVRTSS